MQSFSALASFLVKLFKKQKGSLLSTHPVQVVGQDGTQDRLQPAVFQSTGFSSMTYHISNDHISATTPPTEMVDTPLDSPDEEVFYSNFFTPGQSFA